LIDSFDILMTLQKLARPLSGTDFCSPDQIQFHMLRAWFVKTHFSGMPLWSSEIENAFEIRFQMPQSIL